MYRENGYRGRGRGAMRGRFPSRGKWAPRPTKAPQPVLPPTPEPLKGKLLGRIDVEDEHLDVLDHGRVPRITDCELLASYNWLETPESPLAVPGMPPKWTPPTGEVPLLEEDSGTYYRDRNAAHSPVHPLDPTVKAVLASCQDSGDQGRRRIDIVSCASTLGNLLRFASRRPPDRPYRMFAHFVGDTLHLVRRENSPTETIADVRGYGHTFPEAYTTWDAEVRGSSSYQRVIRYKFGGLDCAVLFEGDGYLPEKLGHKTNGPPVKVPPASMDSSFENLITDLSYSRVSPSGASVALHGHITPDQPMVRAGRPIPQSALFELKTRSIRAMEREDDMIQDQLPRLWIRQISNFILAYHTRGSFYDIQTRDMAPDVRAWENEHLPDLARFSALLHHIMHLAQSLVAADNERGSRRGLEIMGGGEGDTGLEIRELMPEVPLPLSTETEDRWKDWLGRAEPGPGSGSTCSPGPPGADLLQSWSSVQERNDDDDDTSSGELDFTACSSAQCGYCGRCSY